ncbi:MAG: hypothetical protein AAF098_10615 [Pseudomonadota bacterium]
MATLLAHELLGAPMVLPPLADAGLADEVVWLHHFSWHVGSVAVVAMAAMFLYASVKAGNLPMAFIASLMSLGFALLGIGLGVLGSSAMWGTPAPYVWTVIAVLGLFGLWSAKEAR